MQLADKQGPGNKDKEFSGVRESNIMVKVKKLGQRRIGAT